MFARDVPSYTETNCWLGKNNKERFNTSYPWREPESAQFHSEMEPRGSTHTHTTTRTHRVETQTLSQLQASC